MKRALNDIKVTFIALLCNKRKGAEKVDKSDEQNQYLKIQFS